MGLLDDAIREHLELKRRHGADPEEVARQEAEALGAPRRGEFAPSGDETDVSEEPAASAAPAEPAEAPPGPADAAEAPPEPVDEPVVPPSDPGEAPGGEAASEVVPPPEVEDEQPSEPAPGYDEDPWLDEPDEVPSTETLEHPAATPEGEDVLEETPEFLQETPEHDRLWFEQKPPRDFDWDK